jgi:predicted CoA-binding protein
VSVPEVPARWQDPGTILGILNTAKTIAIVGLSPNELRASHFVGFYLRRHGYTVVPVNPREKTIFGETSYPDLASIPFAVDVVNVFRAPDAVPGVASDAVKIGAKTLWCQYEVINLEGGRIAEQGGLRVVMDRCMKVEHARHLGRMHWLGFNTGQITARRRG